MHSIKDLIRGANPVPEERSGELSRRAQAELAGLVGTPAALAADGQRRGHSRRRAVLVGTAVAALAAGVGLAVTQYNPEPPPTAAEPVYRDVQSLTGRADIIVRATIRAIRDEEREGVMETVASAEVSAVAKGDVAKGVELEFAYTQPGSAPEAPSNLRVGGEYVLLLETRVDAPAFVVNSFQGYYPISDNRPLPGKDNPVALDANLKKQLGLR